MSIEDPTQNLAAPRLLAIDDAARLCGSISSRTLRRHIAAGAIRVTRIGRRVFLRSEEIERIRREGLPSLRAKICGDTEVTTNVDFGKENSKS
jgi:hypothetical protein